MFTFTPASSTTSPAGCTLLFDKEGKFYPVDTLSIDEIRSVQERIRKRVLRLFRKKGLLDSDVTSDMLEWENGGFSLNANVRIETEDRDGLERLIRSSTPKMMHFWGPRLCKTHVFRPTS
ncbi:MAG: transposase [Parachlamydiales bacterium]|nr:transposase [Parachlamydiales bacterium]